MLSKFQAKILCGRKQLKDEVKNGIAYKKCFARSWPKIDEMVFDHKIKLSIGKCDRFLIKNKQTTV